MSFKKNTAVIGMSIRLISAADGSDITTGTPVGYYTLDNGSQATIADTPIHKGNGEWNFDLTAAEMNGDTVSITITHTSAITAGYTIKTVDKLTGELNDFDSTNDEVSANITAINSDATSPVNLANTYNGVGYTDDNAPATQLQIGSIGSGSGALNKQCNTTPVVTTGVPTGDETDTQLQDDSYFQVASSGGTVNTYLEYQLSGNESPIEVLFNGRFHDDNIDKIVVKIYAMNWGTGFEQIGSFEGKRGSQPKDDKSSNHQLLSRHVGTGGDLGKVQVQFYVTGLTDGNNPELFIDQLLVTFTNTSESVGYANGSIWVDTVNGTSGQEPFLNGTADKPCPWADALALSTILEINKFTSTPNSNIILDANSDGYNIIGNGATLNLGNQSISGTLFNNLKIIGSAGSATLEPKFSNCYFDNSTIPPCTAYLCGFIGTVIGSIVGDYFFIDCYSKVAGAGSPEFTLASGTGNNISVRRFGGGLALTNIEAGDVLSAEATVGGTLTINGTGGAVEMRGGWKQLNDLSNAVVTIVRSKTYSDLGAIVGNEASAINLEASTQGIIKDLVATVGTSTTCTLNNIPTVDGVLKGRALIVISGSLFGEAKKITGNTVGKVITFDEMVGVLAQNDIVVIV